MFSQAKSNRIIYEREKVKDHVMHIERLRQIKPTMQISKPRKASHLKTNAKREMQNLERMSEIQYQNRILLRKMLQIDLKPSMNVVSNDTLKEKPESNPNGLNAYNSLNRAVRIQEIARVADSNKNILGRLQGTKSHYSTDRWNKDFDHQRRIIGNIQSNGDRFCKNPYFLHSVCTQQDVSRQHTYYAGASANMSALNSNLGTGRQRSARSSTKHNGRGKKMMNDHDVYQQLSDVAGSGQRPLSAPKHSHGNKRAVSANNRRRPRVQSSRVKQIKQYLSEQEAANMQMHEMALAQQQQQQQMQQMQQLEDQMAEEGQQEQDDGEYGEEQQQQQHQQEEVDYQQEHHLDDQQE